MRKFYTKIDDEIGALKTWSYCKKQFGLALTFNGLLVCIFLFIILNSCSKQIDGISAINETDQERWLKEICSSKYKGRKAGTKECNSVADYISRELIKMGYEVHSQDFMYMGSLNLKNIYVKCSGVSDSLLVIGAHYDGAIYGENYPAADDNGSGVVALLSICKILSEIKIQINKSVVLAFWAAEEVTLNNPFNGSRYFVNHFDERDRISFYCNLDCFAHKDQGLYFYHAPGEDNVGQIMDSLLVERADSHIEVIVKVNDKFNSDYVPFYQSGYSYFGWNDYETLGHIHSSKDRIDIISMEKINKVVDLTVALINVL